MPYADSLIVLGRHPIMINPPGIPVEVVAVVLGGPVLQTPRRGVTGTESDWLLGSPVVIAALSPECSVYTLAKKITSLTLIRMLPK